MGKNNLTSTATNQWQNRQYAYCLCRVVKKIQLRQKSKHHQMCCIYNLLLIRK